MMPFMTNLKIARLAKIHSLKFRIEMMLATFGLLLEIWKRLISFGMIL
jgi:hypothetical protein